MKNEQGMIKLNDEQEQGMLKLNNEQGTRNDKVE
jgi:hypothetical protein